MDMIFVFLVMKMLDGSVKAVTSPPVTVVENVDPEFACEDQALKMLLKQKNIAKFDYACFPPPDFNSDPDANTMIELMKKDIANHSV